MPVVIPHLLPACLNAVPAAYLGLIQQLHQAHNITRASLELLAILTQHQTKANVAHTRGLAATRGSTQVVLRGKAYSYQGNHSSHGYHPGNHLRGCCQRCLSRATAACYHASNAWCLRLSACRPGTPVNKVRTVCTVPVHFLTSLLSAAGSHPTLRPAANTRSK